MEKKQIANWLYENIHVCLVAISLLFLIKPGSFESFGLFLLAIGGWIGYNRKRHQVTLEQVIDISENMAEEVVSTYMQMMLSQPEPEEIFNPDTFPPWTKNDDETDNPFSEN